MGEENAYLEAVDLACGYQNEDLFSDLNFKVESGQVMQIEGGNGCGKTTLLRVICGLKWPAEGHISWCGKDIASLKHEYYTDISYIGHLSGVKGDLSPIENLALARKIGVERHGADLDEAICKVGLDGYQDVPCRTLSAGQKRRVALARLIVTESKLWILDEPFTAIDKAGKLYIESLLTDHTSRGGMAILSTHQAVVFDETRIKRLQL